MRRLKITTVLGSNKLVIGGNCPSTASFMGVAENPEMFKNVNYEKFRV